MWPWQHSTPDYDEATLDTVVADMNAGHFRRDVAEGAANLARRVRFRVPHVDVARSAGEPEEDHVRLALCLPGRSRQRLRLEQRRHRNARQARETCLKKTTPRGANAHQISVSGTEGLSDGGSLGIHSRGVELLPNLRRHIA